MKNVTPIIFLLTFLIINSNIYIINCQVEHSFDLNCDFDKDNLCLWHNSNITWDHTSDWSISKSTLNITSINKEIVPMPLNNGFIYTNGTNNGLNTALLVSDVISCQLGGAEINYWYYKTQINSRLEICIRQPPGSLNFLHQKCYDGVQAIQANQWVYQKIELPPFSQPFEILIRGYFIQPDDIIAIDKISYEAALCESVIQGSNKNDAGFILDDEYKLFGTKTYINNKDKTKLEYDYDTFFSENSSCSPINCNFNNNNFCEWISLDDDSDIALTFSMYDTNIKKWSFGINSLGNSVTGILDNQNKRKNYIYAGDTNNPNDIFILSTQKEIFFNQPSKILFDFYHAGIHGELKVCLDTINTCPFSFSSNNLTINSRKWQKGEIIIPDISKHRILIYTNGLINNYFIGFDNIRLTQLNTHKAADCS